MYIKITRHTMNDKGRKGRGKKNRLTKISKDSLIAD